MEVKLHGNTKYKYPFEKECKICGQSFLTYNHTQALRNKVCSDICRNKAVSISKKGKIRVPNPICLECKMEFSHAEKRRDAKRKQKYCSNKCYGLAKSRDEKSNKHMRNISKLGRSSWTEESYKSYSEKMSGKNNSAWKGGVTIFRKHGNYSGVKYIRCPKEYLQMARKDGYIMEHRLIVAQQLNRILLRQEVVHHIDHDPTNNNIKNLMLFANNKLHKMYEAGHKVSYLWSGNEI